MKSAPRIALASASFFASVFVPSEALIAPLPCATEMRLPTSAVTIEKAPSVDSLKESKFSNRHQRDASFRDDTFWELRLYNDEDNYEFWVAEQLVKVTGLTEIDAFNTVKTADSRGEAPISQYDCFELAEFYHGALQAEGLAVQLHPISMNEATR